ncbi:hypothetical protein [Rhodopila globiformis]|uniref:hypothetical protein n=1 Tax=Rhodopila globiformis TaxID=1071 RepID=UPI001EFE5BD8|nr:hypothetical protein [Rhodopila globiformis]
MSSAPAPRSRSPWTGPTLRPAIDLPNDPGRSYARTPLPKPPNFPAPASLDYDPSKPVATREAYGFALKRLGAVNPHIVAVSGDVKNSTFSEIFGDAFPDHFYQGYIAEQNLVSAGVGLAARGKVPFLDTFACFLARAYDQVRMAAISRSNINLCGSHCGVSIGEDSRSHMALEDIAMFRAVHSSTVLYPGDAISTERLVETMAGACRHQLPADVPAEISDSLFAGREVPDPRIQGAPTILILIVALHKAPITHPPRPIHQLAQDQANLDCLADVGIICDEQPWHWQAKGHQQRYELVGPRFECKLRGRSEGICAATQRRMQCIREQCGLRLNCCGGVGRQIKSGRLNRNDFKLWEG